MQVRGHAGVWHQQVPQWVQSLDGPELTKAIQTHIPEVLQHYKNDLYSFDVCNEVVGDDGSLRKSFWSDKLQDTFIETAFQAALDAGTNIKLYINDYNVESIGKKSDTLFKITQQLVAKKLIHGVGFQAHLIVGKIPSLEDIKKNLQRFVALGVEVAFTELDIRMPVPASKSDQAQQAKDFATVVRACREVSGCKGVTVWGVTYLDSWVPSTFPGNGDALLFDNNYQPTEAFSTYSRGFQ